MSFRISMYRNMSDLEHPPKLNITDWKDFLEKAKAYFKDNWYRKTESTVSINDFERVKTIGTGSFGRVILVRMITNGNYYAIKIIHKHQIIKMKQLEHTLNEKRVLQSTVFPFIVHMEHFFKDNVYLYFVMPFIMGGELFSHLRKTGKFPEPQSIFYSAQIVLALDYLHSLDIAYRDLKPENILLDHWGYLKLTDLGFCKIIKGRTYTLCGTPEYLAPEIIMSKGYGLAVDWWSMGVLIYELCAGFPPFYSAEPMKIYEQIVVGKFKMIPIFSTDLKDILKCLLQTDVSKRYGNLRNGAEDIKRHKWFKNVVWLDVLNRRVKAPFVPVIHGRGDAGNYDPYDEEPLKTSSRDSFAELFAEF